MGRQSKPTPEELRFVYDLILNGYSDRDVLEEYCSLYESGLLKFPFRTDPRFVKDRRKELQAAAEVLQEELKKRVDPIIAERRQQHFDQLAGIASTLLGEDIYKKEPDPSWEEYGGSLPPPLSDWMTNEQLTGQLRDNWDGALVTYQYNQWDFDCLVSHLKAEYPEIVPLGLDEAIRDNPRELMQALRVVSRRKTFKGTCPVCPD